MTNDVPNILLDTASSQGSLPPDPTQAANSTRPIRRVGTFTMALSLIATGILLILQLLIPSLQSIHLFRFSPIILIFLGIEILIANTFTKTEKLRYDFLSIVICFFMITSSILLSFLPVWIANRYLAQQQGVELSYQFEQKAFTALQEDGIIAQFEGHIGIDTSTYESGLQLNTLKPYHYVQTRVYFNGEFASREEFVAACQKVLKKLYTIVPHINYISFHSNLYMEYGFGDQYYGEEAYTLYLEGEFQMSWDKDKMSKNTLVYRWLATEKTYVTLEEYEHRLQNPEDYAETIDPEEENSIFYSEEEPVPSSMAEETASLVPSSAAA